MVGFQYKTTYTVTTASQLWKVTIFEGTAVSNKLAVTYLGGCGCSPFVVNPVLGKTITMLVVSPDGIKTVSEVSVAIP
jgi:hypothetical protein